MRRGEQAVEVSVADRGPGMTTEQIARSFDRFWRAADADHPGPASASPSSSTWRGRAAATSAWRRRVGGGLVATVRLPVVADGVRR